MTTEELRVFFGEHFCGCGCPQEAARALLRLLRLHPLYDNRPAFEAWITDHGIQYLLLYWLDRAQLTEHGGTVGGAWLTPKGEAVRDALAVHEGDDFEELCEMSCIHGYRVDDDDHDCAECDSAALNTDKRTP